MLTISIIDLKLLHPICLGKSFCLPETDSPLIKEVVNPCHLTEFKYHKVKSKLKKKKKRDKIIRDKIVHDDHVHQ